MNTKSNAKEPVSSGTTVLLALLLVVALTGCVARLTPPGRAFSGYTGFRLFCIVVVVLSIVAGLVSYIVAALVALIARRSRRRALSSGVLDASKSGEHGWVAVLRSRCALVAFPLGFALGLYLLLDLEWSVSVYPRFVVIYAAFWALFLLLLLWGAPLRHKLAILAPLVVTLLTIGTINWNSRKPFLRDLHRIKEGMTAAQVEQIMGDYMTGGGVPSGSPGIRLDGRLTELGATATGTISYRHTNEGWGNSDWGVVTFKDGRVVDVWFDSD
jgi:hypothetical protein